MNYTPLTYIYKAAATPGASTLLLLHGTGGDETDLIPLAKQFGEAFNILSLRGNVSEHGMPRFFKRLGMGIFDEADLRFRTDELVNFINELAAKEGFDINQLIALGYSNGANIAGSILVMYPNLLKAAILYRPMQPFKQLPEEWKTDRQAPVFLSNGKMDNTINPLHTQQYSDALQRAGFAVTAHEIATGHQLTQEDVATSIKWLKSLYK